MPLNFQYLEAGDSITTNSVFIPATNLPGIQAAELAPANTDRESKIGFALLNALVANLPSNALGLTAQRGNPQGAGLDIWNQGFTFTVSHVVNLAAGTVGIIPVPTTGSNDGVGDFGFSDLFANYLFVFATEEAESAGVAIPHPSLIPYGLSLGGYGGTPDATDARSWVIALLLHMANDASLRSNNTASAVIQRTRSQITGGAVPANLIAATNPLSGLDPADAPKLAILTSTFSFTYQLLADQATQTFDVRHVTA